MSYEECTLERIVVSTWKVLDDYAPGITPTVCGRLCWWSDHLLWPRSPTSSLSTTFARKPRLYKVSSKATRAILRVTRHTALFSNILSVHVWLWEYLLYTRGISGSKSEHCEFSFEQRPYWIIFSTCCCQISIHQNNRELNEPLPRLLNCNSVSNENKVINIRAMVLKPLTSVLARMLCWCGLVAATRDLLGEIVPLEPQDISADISLVTSHPVVHGVRHRHRSLHSQLFPSGTPADQSCETHRSILRVHTPGCIPKQVMTTACRGTCRSYSFPEWNSETESTDMVHNCSCCKPLQRYAITVPLECPFRVGGKKKVVVWGALDCRCRPCSDRGDVEGEQPYDYWTGLWAYEQWFCVFFYGIRNNFNAPVKQCW